MALNKQAVPINFSQGLDLKTDSKQVSIGRFLSLENSVFDKGGLLTKRNGFGQLTPLPDNTASFATTFNGNLTAIGPKLQAYSAATDAWINKGPVLPVSLSTLPLVRNGVNQTQSDAAVAPNGLVCTVYTEVSASGTAYKYVVADSNTGQNLVLPTVIPSGAGTIVGAPRVFVLGNYFLIMISNMISSTNHLQAVPVNTSSLVVGTTIDISATYTPAAGLDFDAVVVNSTMYIAWNGSDGGGALHAKTLTASLALSTQTTYSGQSASLMSLSADTTGTTPVIYITYYNNTNVKTLAVDKSLNTLLAATTLATPPATVLNLSSAAQNGVLTALYEVTNAYGYDSTLPTHYVSQVTCTQTGTVGTPAILLRSVGLASKAFIINSVIYCLTVYSSPYQPTYFLVNTASNVVARLAYSNGGGYYTTGTPSVTVNGTEAQLSYLFKDSISAVSKTVDVPAGSQVAGIYSQTGVNLCSFEVGSATRVSTEIADNLHLSGGIMFDYDGQVATENNFFLWPSSVEATTTTNSGGLSPQKYYYTATYETADNQGNVIRSAPSIPILVDLSQGSVVTFTSTFAAGATNIVVSSATGLYVGQTVTDVTTTANIAYGTIITGIAGTTITLSLATVEDSATGGDTLSVPVAVSTTASFSANSTTLTVASATGFYVGQVISDVTTAASIYAGTYITHISGTTFTISQATTAAASSDSIVAVGVYSATVNVPTIRLTYRSSCKIVIYRWSVGQQVSYRVTSLTTPLMNNPAIDYVTFTDVLGDGAILGNDILYTTGGVVENISPPATSIMTLFDTRQWLVDAEDPNLLWFSKQVIEDTPVEMSDLFTLYVAPTISAQGSTGPITALAAMDDKLVIFKADAIYYLNGTGPDNTGSNNGYSPATFVAATVGCIVPNSLVLQPDGLMFQSDKGIWLLNRSLQTSYIGAAVEDLTLSNTVLSAVNVPGTNQIRFTLDSGVTLMYDYYYSQWGSFVNVPALSSTLYQGLHTFINAQGQVYQETDGLYLDGSNPTLLSFTTGWLNVAGLQGYERAYFFYLLAEYFSPHKLQVSIAYDYNPAATQVSIISPDNFNPNWGGDNLWGSSVAWGGNPALEQWRVFLQKQRCQAFQITVQEIYDPTLGVAAGAGFTMSGINLVIGTKKGFPTLRPSRSVG